MKNLKFWKKRTIDQFAKSLIDMRSDQSETRDYAPLLWSAILPDSLNNKIKLKRICSYDSVNKNHELGPDRELYMHMCAPLLLINLEMLLRFREVTPYGILQHI